MLNPSKSKTETCATLY